MTATPTFPTLLQDFFHQHLLAQRQASPRTVASYRDAFRLLLTHAHDRLHKPPSAVTLADLDAPLLLAFLDHLEGTRHNGARTRNARLAALRSFLHYASVRDPTALAVIQRALAIPTKRFDRPLLGFLSRVEIDALLAAPDRSTWSGHRDHVLFTTLYNTGARVSEIIGVRVADLVLEPVAHVRLHGKGRKDRTVPLWKSTAKRLKEWLSRVKAGPDTPLFPNGRGVALSRSGVERRLRAAVTSASVSCPTLATQRISPHTLRNTTAMHLLQSGVDLSVIALWLGHESLDTLWEGLLGAFKVERITNDGKREWQLRIADRLVAMPSPSYLVEGALECPSELSSLMEMRGLLIDQLAGYEVFDAIPGPQRNSLNRILVELPTKSGPRIQPN